MSTTTASVSTPHPAYAAIAEDWTKVRDFAAGPRQVKSKRTTYLPATSGMRQKDFGSTTGLSEGDLLYSAYIARAVVPELVQPAVNALVGVMHREAAEIQLPKVMEPLRDNATVEGESLLTLLRRINSEQVEVGRIGLMVDVPAGGVGVLPYIVTYDAENIINWDCSRRPDGRDRPDFIVLDESSYERSERFTWEWQSKYLVIDLVTPGEVPDEVVNQNFREASVTQAEQSKVYRSQLILQDKVSDTGVVPEGINRQTDVVLQDTPQSAVFPNIGGQSREELPFVFIGSIDLTSSPDQVPMLPLANLSHDIYLGEADYRHTLFQQGQATLVVVGDSAPSPNDPEGGKVRVMGASASLDLPVGGKAEYIGAPADGIEEQRKSIENDRNRASELGANLLSNAGSGNGGGGREASESLKIRVAARTATLTSVVTSGAEGLQTALRIIAEWMGANPKEVVVTPNMDFVEDTIPTSDVVDLTTAKSAGAPISQQTIHGFMKSKDLTTLTFKEEMALIDQEEPLNPAPRAGDNPDPDEEARRLADEENDDNDDKDKGSSGTEDDN